MGDALFFENIRDFLGVTSQERTGRKTPNKEIIKTVTTEADKMLSRNNGIVFSILALCGLVNINIAERKADTLQEYTRMTHFFSEAQKMLDNHKDAFLKCYLYSVKVWMHEMNVDAEPKEVQKNMNNRSRSLSFNSIYRNFCLERDMQEGIEKIRTQNDN